jgi:hypothetical protein
MKYRVPMQKHMAAEAATAGENDHFSPRQVEMINALCSQGIKSRYVIEAERGHV